jgi:hypothetical protein
MRSFALKALFAVLLSAMAGAAFASRHCRCRCGNKAEIERLLKAAPT